MEATTTTEIPHVIVQGSAKGYAQEIETGAHRLLADEPISYGGGDTGPGPYDLLLASLGACTSMTVSWYARSKKIPLEHVRVELWHSKVHAKDCAECETKVGRIDRIEMKLHFVGDITEEQRAKLVQIASRCPVHQTLKSEIDIRTQIA